MCCYVGALDLPPRTHQVARWKEHRVVQDSVAQSLYAAEKVCLGVANVLLMCC